MATDSNLIAVIVNCRS